MNFRFRSRSEFESIFQKKLVPGLLVLSHRARNYAPALEVLDNLPPAAPHGLWIGDRETLVCDRWRSGSAIYEVNG